jgi:Cu2+-exporting ATPase
MRLLPKSVLRRENGTLKVAFINDVKPDDCLLVKAGDIIPVDGYVIEGRSTVNEAALTGEYLPITKSVNSSVLAGSLNVEQPLIIQVERIGQHSQLYSIIRLVERAQTEKPYLAQTAHKMAQWFIASELFITLVVGIAWFFIDPHRAFWIMLSILVVTCPCALSLATPTAITAATVALRARGVLITRGHVLETLPHITHVVFDKTGTLTMGSICLEKIILCGDLTEDQCLDIACALEAHSEHPIAQAFNQSTSTLAHHIHLEPGQGIQGIIDNTLYKIGSVEFAFTSITLTPPSNDKKWLLLANDKQPLAWFALNDQIRPGAEDAVRALQQIGIKTILLSGDTSAAVEHVANALHINCAIGGLSPEAKLDYVAQLQQTPGTHVLMVGDGLNDVPVLARSHISVAMGCGTDLTRTQSDVVLLTNDLAALSGILKKAKHTRLIIQQNFSWAIAYNLCMIPLASLGLINPYYATIGMSLSSMLVVANALRLTRPS